MIQGINHIAIVVPNMEDARCFYESQLGFQLGESEILRERGLEIVFVPIGDTRLELIAPIRDDSEISTYLKKRGGGIHHIAFDVDNIDQAHESLVQSEVRLTSKEPQSGAHNTRVSFIHPKSSGGVLMELVEEKGESHVTKN